MLLEVLKNKITQVLILCAISWMILSTYFGMSLWFILAPVNAFLILFAVMLGCLKIYDMILDLED